MDILNRIILLLGEKDQKELTDYLNLKKSAFTDWKSGKSNSYRKYLIEIADFFGVSIDYLVYGKTSASTPPQQNGIQLTDGREQEMLRLFRSLSDMEKDRLIGRAEYIVEQSKREENSG